MSLTLTEPALLRQQCYIDGQWRDANDATIAESGTTAEPIAVTNPATGAVVAHVPNLGARATDFAIAAAARAQKQWQGTVAAERATILRRWYALMLEHQEDLARLMTAEQGKPIAEARGEIAYAASFIEWFAEQARRITGEIIQPHQADKRLLVLKQPIGVCVAITPWNFPAAMITRKVAPALAAGCAMVVKPASETPLSALALCVLAERAGLPNGLLNVITGTAKPIGQAMTAHPLVRHLSFTGSTEIGRVLMSQCAPQIIKIALELGGNAPFIVFDDADLDAAVVGAMISKYRNAGQTCVCANRLYVQAGVYDEFVARLSAQVAALNVGDGSEAGVEQGPLIDRAAVEKVEQHIADAIAHGAQVVTGGARHARGGTFFQPTVLKNVTTKMAVAREETFGPVAPVFRFNDEAEVIEMANATEFGLASYFYSTNLARVWRVAEQLEYGMVGINTGLVSTEVAPFGGVKQSGLGREGAQHGIDEYLEMKYLCLGGIE